MAFVSFYVPTAPDNPAARAAIPAQAENLIVLEPVHDSLAGILR